MADESNAVAPDGDGLASVRDLMVADVQDLAQTVSQLLYSVINRSGGEGFVRADPVAMMEHVIEQDAAVKRRFDQLVVHQERQARLAADSRRIQRMEADILKILAGLEEAQGTFTKLLELKEKIVEIADTSVGNLVMGDVEALSLRYQYTTSAGVRWAGQDHTQRDQRFMPPCPTELQFQFVHREIWGDFAAYGLREPIPIAEPVPQAAVEAGGPTPVAVDAETVMERAEALASRFTAPSEGSSEPEWESSDGGAGGEVEVELDAAVAVPSVTAGAGSDGVGSEASSAGVASESDAESSDIDENELGSDSEESLDFEEIEKEAERKARRKPSGGGSAAGAAAEADAGAFGSGVGAAAGAGGGGSEARAVHRVRPGGASDGEVLVMDDGDDVDLEDGEGVAEDGGGDADVDAADLLGRGDAAAEAWATDVVDDMAVGPDGVDGEGAGAGADLAGLADDVDVDAMDT